MTDGDKRLIALLIKAFGNDHPAFDDLMALVTAARYGATPPAAQQAEPVAGWKLVPVEPTTEMVTAIPFPTNVTPNIGIECWRAMLAAAPPAAQQAEPVAKKCAKCQTPASCDGDGLCLEVHIAGRIDAEREACAQECDKIERRKWDVLMHGGAMSATGARGCAAAIRARGQS